MLEEACLKAVNSNAENETQGTIDFALPGARKQPKPFLKLLKEAREANLVPPSLPTPSYSWDKVECPEQDCMILPARRPKQPKEGESKDLTTGNNCSVSNNAVEEPVKEEKQPSPSKGPPKPKAAPTLQEIIEKMQKCQEVEKQLKASKEAQRAKQLAGTIQKAMTASQALKKAKVTTPIDYRERKRLRQEKEIEEARKELMEAARNALQDRIEFNKREKKNSRASSTVGKTLFCGSTNAMFNPEAPVGETEEVLSEESEEDEAVPNAPLPEPTPQVIAREPSPNPQPTIPQTACEVQPSAAENKVEPKAEEPPKEEKPAEDKSEEKKKKKKRRKKTHKNKKNDPQAGNATNVPPNMQTQPMGGNLLVNPMQSCLMPQPMVMPMPFAMQQPQLSPYGFTQVFPPTYPFMGGHCYGHFPFEGAKYRKQRHRKHVKRRGDSYSSSSESPSTTTTSSSSSSFSDLSSFESGSTFSGNTEGSSTSTISSSIFSSSDEDDETGSSENSSTDSSESDSPSSGSSSQSGTSCYDSSYESD